MKQYNEIMTINPMAGKPATPDMPADIAKLLTAYFTGKPGLTMQEQRVSFG